jgi:outer membrane receptor for ferrienterochelin and colicin
MKYKSRLIGSTLTALRQAGVAALGALMLLAIPVAGNAQETTSAIQGAITDPAGNPVAGVSISIRHEPTGRTQTVNTGDTGFYRLSGLRVGGPYTVTLQPSSNYGGNRVEQVYISLGDAYVLDLTAPTTAIEEIVVTATPTDAGLRIGAGSSYGLENINAQANVGRDIKNIIRQDPRVSIDLTNQGAASIGGSNNRFNSFTVDGVRQNDDFGLNGNGYPSQRIPLSIDAIEQIVVEVAPFDVSFGGFTGGTINAVTKSGTNEWDGSVAFYHSDDSLLGDKTEDDIVDLGKFDEDTLAATLSGPIIKDRLWFFAAYEDYTETDTSGLEFGPEGSGRSTEVSGVTQSEVDEVIRIADQVYGFNAGVLPSGGQDVTDEKLLVKLDWAINDSHNATLTYQDVLGNSLVPQGSSDTRLGLPSNWYDRSEDLETLSLQVFSSWSDVFSTEIKIGTKEQITGQNSLGGNDFAQMTIETPSGGDIRIGPDIFRHANELTNKQKQLKLKGEYLLGDHTVTFGYERDAFDIFNLFVFQSEGDYIFDSFTDFENRTASALFYRNAFTNDENDGAATFKFEINSLYVQDEVDVSDQLSLLYGIRYDYYTGNSQPRENPGFNSRYGFSNTANLDGRDAIMPRFGFTYDLDSGALVRGGIGLFSGGNPVVWVSNSFSNDGVIITSPDDSGSFDPTCTDVTESAAALTNVDGFNIAPEVLACMFTGAGDVEATDPNFKIPSTWRFNLAYEQEFDLGFLGDDWLLSAEAVLSRAANAVEWRELRRTQIDTAPDGRPIYDRPPTYDVILTNTSDGKADTYSLAASKLWDTRAGVFDFAIAYTYMDAEDVNPSQSSTVSSNYGRPATFDRNNRQLSTSDFEVENRINGSASWTKDLFGDNMTQVSLFFEWRSGKPYSYTMREETGDSTVWGGDTTFSRRDSQLLYVPLLNDPNVIFSTGDNDSLVNDPALEANFNAFVAAAGLEGYRGQIMPRNFDYSDDRTRFDLRIVQEIGLGTLPGVGESKVSLYFDIENLGNLLNDDWGRIEQVFFPFNHQVVDVYLNANGQYVYEPNSGSSFDRSINPNSRDGSGLTSVWKAQFGVKVQF